MGAHSFSNLAWDEMFAMDTDTKNQDAAKQRMGHVVESTFRVGWRKYVITKAMFVIANEAIDKSRLFGSFFHKLSE